MYFKNDDRKNNSDAFRAFLLKKKKTTVNGTAEEETPSPSFETARDAFEKMLKNEVEQEDVHKDYLYAQRMKELSDLRKKYVANINSNTLNQNPSIIDKKQMVKQFENVAKQNANTGVSANTDKNANTNANADTNNNTNTDTNSTPKEEIVLEGDDLNLDPNAQVDLIEAKKMYDQGVKEQNEQMKSEATEKGRQIRAADAFGVYKQGANYETRYKGAEEAAKAQARTEAGKNNYSDEQEKYIVRQKLKYFTYKDYNDADNTKKVGEETAEARNFFAEQKDLSETAKAKKAELESNVMNAKTDVAHSEAVNKIRDFNEATNFKKDAALGLSKYQVSQLIDNWTGSEQQKAQLAQIKSNDEKFKALYKDLSETGKAIINQKLAKINQTFDADKLDAGYLDVVGMIDDMQKKEARGYQSIRDIASNVSWDNDIATIKINNRTINIDTKGKKPGDCIVVDVDENRKGKYVNFFLEETRKDYIGVFAYKGEFEKAVKGTVETDFDITKFVWPKNNTAEAVLEKQMKKNPQIQKNGKWVNASRDEVLQCLDPKKCGEGIYKYQFLDLSASAGISEGDMAKFLSGKGTLAGNEKTYLEAAKKYNVSEVYLAAHSALETGNGKSTLAKGVVVNGVTVYNMYGIGAFDTDPVGAGAQFAYKMGWTTSEKAIEGGAKWISEQYINNASYKQNNLYKMRWNPASPGNHQYATDIGWALKQTYNIKKMYDNFENASLIFELPKYN